MLNQQSTIATAFMAVNHSINTAPQPRTLHVPSSSPSKLIHLDATRQYLGNASLSESYLLDISRQAIMSGHCEQKYIDGVIYHQIVWNNLYFVLSQSFDTLLLISRHDTSKALPAQPFNILHHAEDTEEYEQIIDEIVDCVDRDMQTHFADYDADQTFDTFYSASPTPSPSEQNQIGQIYACSASRESASPSPTESLSTQCTCSYRGVSYHDIYLKPIMERLSKCEPTTRVTGNYVAEIVSLALTKGVKRQISKRTFSFLWNGYTVVMSKSLRTILDVAVAREGDVGEVVTVHPDVVSILTKKHPLLDYFEIQRVAARAKQSGEFTTKKNDYRRQFVYDFEQYRIVFASNHFTIVEMQFCG